MSFPHYKSYKDSGVEWLGEVPEHWEVISIKWLSPVQRGASPRPIDDPKYFDDDGEYAWVRIADVSASDGVLRETTQKLSALGGSLSVKIAPGELFISIASTVGKPCISQINACIHDGFVYFPRLEINPNFLYRIFESGTCYGGLGKWGTQLNLNTDTIGSIRIALPPQEELSQVITFLDRETAKIDALIAEQQRLIELLKEKRQAVISQAVTKGLTNLPGANLNAGAKDGGPKGERRDSASSPDAPMKDSGIEWLGEVPEHWEICALKRIANMKSGDSITSDSIEEVGEYSVFGGNGLRGYTNSYTHDGTYALIGRQGALCGNINYAYGNFWASEHAVVVYPLQSVDTFWLGELLRAMNLNQYSVSAAQPGLSVEIVGNLRIPFPPSSEQSTIAAFLDNETAKLGTLTAEAQRAIELLKERRTALISAAVTGKIDVRTFHP